MKNKKNVSETNDECLVEIGGVSYNSREIRDECLMNLNFVPVLIEYLRNCDKNIKTKIMEDIKGIDSYMYCAIDGALSDIKDKLNTKSFNMFNYFKTKAHVMRQYKNILEKERLFSNEEVSLLLSAESKIFTPDFIKENKII